MLTRSDQAPIVPRMRPLVIASLLTFALAGCKADPAPDPTPPVLPATSASAPAPAPTTAAPADDPEVPAGDCDGSVTGGSGVHRAVMRAWVCDQPQTHLSDAGRDGLDAVPRADINMDWTFVNCATPVSGKFCVYRNELGSDLVLQVPDSAPDTVTDVRFQRTMFYSDAEDYARHFVEAWIGRNFVRMRALSSASIASFAESHTAPLAPWSLTLSPSEVWIFEVDSATADYRVVLQGTLGRPNAVTELNPM